MPRLTLIIVVLLAAFAPLAENSLPAEQPVTDVVVTVSPVREAIARSLPYLEKQGSWWMEEKKCVSCHRVSFQTWSLSEAHRQGFDVDADKLKGWIDWVFEKSLAKPVEGKEVDGALNVDGLAQMLLARSSSLDRSQHEADYAEFVQLLVKGQQPEGFWKAAGQLPGQKRPKDETDQVTTMWIALALGSLTDRTSTAESRNLAVKWLDSAQPGKSIEWYVASLLLAHQDGDQGKTQSALGKLRELQNDNGSWSWLVDGNSDAMATGQTLYALGVVGLPAEDPAVRRGQQFLIDTQQDNGSWAVLGTKVSKKDRVEETATYWGSAWAAIGLLTTLPD